jgi:hypothetical protein
MFEIVRLGKLCKQSGKLRSCQKSLERVTSDPDSASPKKKSRKKMEPPVFEIVQMGKLCEQSGKLKSCQNLWSW